jgi:hypothetical protein
MTLPAFQRALCELIGSPDLCLAVRADASGFLSRYDLSPRERDRLLDIVWQRGMSTNCTLYRSNRVTPIYTLLHYTCMVLGDGLKSTLEAYWRASDLRDLEFKHEIHRFARFLRERIERGAIADLFVEEVLEFELAVNELRFAPRREILRQLRERHDAGNPPAELRVHPLIRVVRFRHEPAELLGALANGRVPRDLADSESFLLLSVVEETLSVRALERQSGCRLWRLCREGISGPTTELEDLIETGFVVRSAYSADSPPAPVAPLGSGDHAHRHAGVAD